MTHWTVVPI